MKTIKTETHWLYVDEEAEIKSGWGYYNNGSIEYLKPNSNVDYNKEWGWFKIIAAYPKMEGMAEFEQFPPNTTKDDIDKLAIEYGKRGDNKERKQIFEIGFKDGYGYKQAKSEVMFSEDDMCKFAQWMIFNYSVYRNHDSDFSKRMLPEFIEKQSKIVKQYEFIPEMEQKCEFPDEIPLRDWWFEPKIINNKIQGYWKLIETNNLKS